MKGKIIRFIVLKIDTKLHRTTPWIVCDILNDTIKYFDSKANSYKYIQGTKQFYEGFLDITEVD